MVCLHCGSETRIINSRSQKRANQVWRRRRCYGCGAVFTTEEKAIYDAEWAVRDKNDTLEPFSRDKLFLSLYDSCRHRETALADAAGLTDTIIKKIAAQIQGATIDKAAISEVAQVALNRFDAAASVQYRAFHA